MGIAVVALVGLVVLLLLLASHDRSSLWVQVGKGLIDLIVVGVLGASIKLLVDEHQDRRRDDQRRQDFRQDKYNRIVRATNTLRRAPMLIKANRSVKTWTEQMIAVIDAGLRLRSIRLEISSSSSARLRPFSNEDDIGNLLDSMYAYVEWIAAEFAEEKKNLEAKQLWAEEKVYLDQGQQKLDLETRKQRQGELWEALRALPRLADMLSNPSQAEISQKRRRMSGRPSQDRAQPSGRLGEKEGSWAGYLAAEADVLELITQAALERPSDTRVLAGTPCNPAIKNDDPTEIPPQQKTIGDDDLAGD